MELQQLLDKNVLAWDRDGVEIANIIYRSLLFLRTENLSERHTICWTWIGSSFVGEGEGEREAHTIQVTSGPKLYELQTQ